MATHRKGSKKPENDTAPETPQAVASPGEPKAKKRRVSKKAAPQKSFHAGTQGETRAAQRSRSVDQPKRWEIATAHHLFELAFAVAANEFAKRLRRPINIEYGRARYEQWMESAANNESIAILIETLNHVANQRGCSWKEMDSAGRELALDLIKWQLSERLSKTTRKRGRQKRRLGIVERARAKAGVPAISVHPPVIRTKSGDVSGGEKDHARRMFCYHVVGAQAALWAIDEAERLDIKAVRQKLWSPDYQNAHLQIPVARANDQAQKAHYRS